MKRAIVTVLLGLLLAGCGPGVPAISKSAMGNLEINVHCEEGADTRGAEIYLDGVFIGNVSRELPVIHAKRGQRVVRVQATGYKPYEKTITILGQPNHQVLNVYLHKQ